MPGRGGQGREAADAKAGGKEGEGRDEGGEGRQAGERWGGRKIKQERKETREEREMKQITEENAGKWRGGGVGSFVACLSHLTTNHASLARRSTVPTPNRHLQQLGAHYAFPYTT